MDPYSSPLISYAPERIVSLLAGAALDPFADVVSSSLAANVLTPEIREMCESIPWLLTRVATHPNASTLVDALSPTAVAMALVLDYDRLASHLEPAAMRSDEGLEILVRVHNSGALRLKNPIRWYAEKIEDPNRLWRLASYYDELAGLENLAEAKAAKQPLWGASKFYQWAVCERGSCVIAPTLLTEEYVFRAALRVRALGGCPDTSGILSPRWAYHALRYGLGDNSAPQRLGEPADAGTAKDCIDETERLIRVLNSSPLWTAQYLEAQDLPIEEARMHLELHLTRLPSEHWSLACLRDWLEGFLERKAKQLVESR